MSGETDESPRFRNLTSPSLRNSNMCLCVAVKTQFQDLALCVHIRQCNPTHLTGYVRLALRVSLDPCLYVCVFTVVNKIPGIVFLVSKRNVNSGR